MVITLSSILTFAAGVGSGGALTTRLTTGAWPELRRQAAAPMETDPLQQIVGIGPVYSSRLKEAGITTFEQLAAMSPEQLEEVALADLLNLQIDAASWIEQAKKKM